MSSAVSTTNANGTYQDVPPAITTMVSDNDTVAETHQHIEPDSVVQAPGNVAPGQSDNDSLNVVGPEASTIPRLEVAEGAVVAMPGSNVRDPGKGSPSERIPIHPKLYKAAVEGDVSMLNEYLLSQESQQLDGVCPLQGVTIGDNTVLHIAATSSNPFLTWMYPSSNYVEFAKVVYGRNISLLMARNKFKETPLHCAAKAGNYKMVSLFIYFAEHEPLVGDETFLTAKNVHGETVLHEAVRIGHRYMVNNLILSEPRLTGIVDADDVSPLYLATMTNAFEIVRVFTREEPSLVSCAGPKGQTALHAAVLEHTDITSELLTWDKSLATKVDDSGSTPLHYAAAAGHVDTVKLLLQVATATAYVADNNKLYPIHIAAKCGRALVIEELIQQVPDSDELLDEDGRNFLHIAIMSGKEFITFSISRTPTFLRMLNARDKKGNTPLHIAGQKGDYSIVRFLVSMKMVCTSIMNRDGLTPVDISNQKVERGFRYLLNPGTNILRCLLWTGALPSPRRDDHLNSDLKIPVKDKKEEVEKADSATRTLGIISVLLSTVTFAAIFTMPGGYIADDHVNRGTPILSSEYAFKAFIVADMLAFALSISATSLLIYAGFSIVDLRLRVRCAIISSVLIKGAAKATVCAFALATYTVLSPVNLPLGTLVCVATFSLLPFSNPTYWGLLLLGIPLIKRFGCIGLFKGKYRVETRRRLAIPIGISYLHWVYGSTLRNLLLYVVIFLLVLIL